MPAQRHTLFDENMVRLGACKVHTYLQSHPATRHREAIKSLTCFCILPLEQQHQLGVVNLRAWVDVAVKSRENERNMGFVLLRAVMQFCRRKLFQMWARSHVG